MNARVGRFLLSLSALTLARWAFADNTANTRYAPPEVTFTADNQLQIFQTEVDHQEFPDAAQRLEDLLRDSSRIMSIGSDGAVGSLGNWARSLPAETKSRLATAMDALEGKAASHALDELRSKADSDPASYYAIFSRYPYAAASATALTDGAKRAAAMGDLATARRMLQLAVEHGGNNDENLAHSLEIPKTSSPAMGTGYRGALPFEATWYGGSLRESWTSTRSFPQSVGGLVFITAPNQVVALKETGGVLWQGPVGDASRSASGAPDPEGVIRGPALTSSVFCDASGSPQIVLVRQPETHGDGWAIRALRASDSKLLWSTESIDTYHNIVFGSNPATEGRYVYAIAADPGEQMDRLSLVALDLTTGRQLWRTDIGNLTRTRIGHRNKGQTDIYRPWMHETAPAIVGDCVLATPDVGAAVLVDRFDGKLRWVHPYDPLPEPTIVTPDESHRVLIEMRRAKAPPKFRPIQPIFSTRFANTPASTARIGISAPQDSDAVMAWDLASGKSLWIAPNLGDATLLGVSGDVAVMGGLTVTGIKVSNGTFAWSSMELRGLVTGPAVLRGKLVYVPTADGITILDAATGHIVPGGERMPSFRAILKNDTARSAMTMTDVIGTFVRDPISPTMHP